MDSCNILILIWPLVLQYVSPPYFDKCDKRLGDCKICEPQSLSNCIVSIQATTMDSFLIPKVHIMFVKRIKVHYHFECNSVHHCFFIKKLIMDYFIAIRRTKWMDIVTQVRKFKVREIQTCVIRFKKTIRGERVPNLDQNSKTNFIWPMGNAKITKAQIHEDMNHLKERQCKVNGN